MLDIAEACAEAGNPNRYFKFASTSKVTFPGAGVAAMAASPENVAEIKKRMGVQTIGHDKTQPDASRPLPEGCRGHRCPHGKACRHHPPEVRAGSEDARRRAWQAQVVVRGATRVVATSFPSTLPKARQSASFPLAKEAGVTMTGAGATYPYKNDPLDSNIRIAPTLAPAGRAGIGFEGIRLLREARFC